MQNYIYLFIYQNILYIIFQFAKDRYHRLHKFSPVEHQRYFLGNHQYFLDHQGIHPNDLKHIGFHRNTYFHIVLQWDDP